MPAHIQGGQMLRRTLFYLFVLTTILLIDPCDVALGAKVVFVGIFVDEEEPAVDGHWRPRLTKRVAAASEIISQYADVRFVVKETGRWLSENSTTELPQSLAEFEKEVNPDGIRLAIGFSSQYRFRSGRSHLGGTRGPLRHHILLRENAKTIREAERLEALVHELGHFLCAGHSGDPNSAMRPVVGDGKARSAQFKIGFDRPNAAILRIVGQELRDGGVDRFQELSPRTLLHIRKSYLQLNRELPKDPVAIHYLKVIERLLAAPRRGGDPGKVLIPVESGTIRER